MLLWEGGVSMKSKWSEFIWRGSEFLKSNRVSWIRLNSVSVEFDGKDWSEARDDHGFGRSVLLRQRPSSLLRLWHRRGILSSSLLGFSFPISKLFNSINLLPITHYMFLCVKCLRLHLQGCEKEVLEAEKLSSDEHMQDCLLRLSWALVHSKHPQDVHRGIAMLEGLSLLLFHNAMQL